jgi:hypothetical protein
VNLVRVQIWFESESGSSPNLVRVPVPSRGYGVPWSAGATSRVCVPAHTHTPMAPRRDGFECGVVWCGVVWCGVVWFGVVWCRIWFESESGSSPNLVRV